MSTNADLRPLDASRTKPLTGGPSYPVSHRLFRFVWSLAWAVLAAWTPAPLHRWRCMVLRAFGATVDRTARVYGGAKVWYPPNLVMHAHAVLGPDANCYCMDRVTVGEKAIVSQGAYLCAGTHDIADPDFQLVTRPIIVSAGAWVAAQAFIGPGVTVGEGAVVGARAVLFKDAKPKGVYVGNPARFVRTRVFRTE